MDNIATLADAIIADNKNGDIDVEEIIFGKLNISDLPLLAELLEGHGSSNEMNTADYALAAINKALGAYAPTLTGNDAHNGIGGHDMNTEWTKVQVITMVQTYPHLTAMEIARRSGWTVWAAEDLLKEMEA